MNKKLFFFLIFIKYKSNRPNIDQSKNDTLKRTIKVSENTLLLVGKSLGG